MPKSFSKLSLLSPQKLHSLLGFQNKVKVLDASWHMPNLNPPRNGYAEYLASRIPGALFWNVDRIANTEPIQIGQTSIQLPHMIPSAAVFQDACQKLGIERDDHLVIYDSVGMFASPRTAWTFAAFGHPKISLLEGGLPLFASLYPTASTGSPEPKDSRESQGPARSEAFYHSSNAQSHSVYPLPDLHSRVVTSYDGITSQILAKKGDVIFDARPGPRFEGSAPEPRPGLSSGHMPGSFSLPFPKLLQSKVDGFPFGSLLPKNELEAVFSSTVGDEVWKDIKEGERNITVSCGSGMTASILWAGLARVGLATPFEEDGQVNIASDQVALYDESWSGYAARPQSRIEKS